MTSSRMPSLTSVVCVSRSTSRMWRGWAGPCSRPWLSNARWITSAPSRARSATRPAAVGTAGMRIATILAGWSCFSAACTAITSGLSGIITNGADSSGCAAAASGSLQQRDHVAAIGGIVLRGCPPRERTASVPISAAAVATAVITGPRRQCWGIRRRSRAGEFP